LLRKKAVALALVGWMDGWMWAELGERGARQQEGLLAAATKLEARLDVGVSVGVGAPATEH
jgi:hypothetical protein